MKTKFSLTTRDVQNDVTVLDLVADGALGAADVTRIEETLAGLYGRGRTRILINCAKLGLITVDGWGALLADLWRVRRAGGDIRFCAPSRPARMMVGELGLASRTKLAETEAKAVTDFAVPSQYPVRAVSPERFDAYEPRTVEGLGDIRLLSCSGSLDERTLPTFKAALEPLLSSPRVIVDLDFVENGTPDAIGALVEASGRAKKAGGELRFVVSGGVLAKSISVLGLDRILSLHKKRAEAIAAFGKSGR
jgi:anti-anti-sigma regulatory factor